ncbi:MAG: hypothetical protein WAV16_04635 [Candidatus Moraniibacteriota bacterium]
MSLKMYIWSLFFSTLLALAVWFFVLFNIDPYESGLLGQIFFFLSLELFLTGVLVSILVLLRAKFLGEDVSIERIGMSFRQGLLISVTFVLAIAINTWGYFTWWIGLLLLAGMFLVELYFLSKE